MRRCTCIVASLIVGCSRAPAPPPATTVHLPERAIDERCLGIYDHLLDLVLLREVLREPGSEIPSPEVLVRAAENLDVEYRADGTRDRFVGWCLDARPAPALEGCMLRARTLGSFELCAP